MPAATKLTKHRRAADSTGGGTPSARPVASPPSVAMPVSVRGAAQASGPLSTRDLASFSATRILQAAVREDVTLSELTALAQGDPAFAMRLLAMVNSAAYRGACQVVELSQAITLLGVRGTRTVALGMVIAELAPPGDAGNLLVLHCIRRAGAARLLGEALGGTASDDYFTVGLLLDAGLLTGTPEGLECAVELAGTPAADRAIRERALGRPEHALVGAKLALRFQLPGKVVRAIRGHHCREMPEDPLAAVAWAAERVAGVFEGGEVALNRDRAYDAGSRIGLDVWDVDQVLAALPAEVERAAGAFSCECAPQPQIAQLLNDARHQLVDMTRHYVEMVQTLERVLEEKDALASELRQANSTLELLAATDPLTSLPNRRAFSDRMTRCLLQAAAKHTDLAVAMLDIDFFKRVNDTHGHAVGDEVLVAVAESLGGALRSIDYVARTGGEEFALLLPGADALSGRGLAERVREAIERRRIDTSRGVLRVTVSIGVASLCVRGEVGDADDLLQRADAALYRAKQAGRNRVVVDPKSPLQ